MHPKHKALAPAAAPDATASASGPHTVPTSGEACAPGTPVARKLGAAPSLFRLTERFSVLRDFASLPTYVQLLLVTQLFFNIGFYMVLPYLATYLGESLGLAGATIGLILGLRSFSQQGLFVLGGTLTDRYGPRAIILIGIPIRIAGFVLLGLSTQLAGVVAGVVLIGFAAALFSPAVESSIARAAGEVEQSTGLPRTQVFAMGSVALQTGATLGPLIGTLLLLVNYRFACLVAAGIFVCVWLAYYFLFPAIAPLHKNESVLQGWGEVLNNRMFLWFALANSTYLLAYNQLYLALPVELKRSMGNDNMLGVLMAISAGMVIVGQVWLTAWARRKLRWQRAIPAGFSIMAAGFAAIALASLVLPLPQPWSIAPALAMIVLFTLGKMLASPFTADLVARLAHERRLGAYYGLLNSFGGLAVLLGSTGIGALLGKGTHGVHVAMPWFVTILLLAFSAGIIVLLIVRYKLGQEKAIIVPLPLAGGKKTDETPKSRTC
ncbi:MAG: MFS transporter [Brachymonas sp.]|nr:MFS transporter [Brachymonas sp.]